MKRILTLLTLAVMTGSICAQVTMRDMLKQMPDTLVPYLTENARLDFIDFIDSNMKAEVSNSLGGKSVLQSLTDVYASLSLSQSSFMELRLLDLSVPVDSANQVLCVVRTYGTDIRASVVDFYSVRWRKLSSVGRVGVPADFSSNSAMYFATLGSDEPTLSVRAELRLDAPADDEQEELSQSSIILKWNGERFNEY